MFHGYPEALARYATFRGRTSRTLYWGFLLPHAGMLVVLAFIDGLTGLYSQQFELGLTSGLYLLATVVPLLALTLRRLHDAGRSGWFALLLLIPPPFTVIPLVAFGILPSDGPNSYGVPATDTGREAVGPAA